MERDEAPENLKNVLLISFVVVSFLALMALWINWIVILDFDALLEDVPSIAAFALFGTFFVWISFLVVIEVLLFPDKKLQKRYKDINKKYSDTSVREIHKREARYYSKWERAKQKVEEMKK